MAKKTKGQEWDEKPFVLGTYKHKKTGKLATARNDSNGKYDWIIDKGKKQKHPFFRLTMPMVEQGTGNYFFNKSLKDYELVVE